MQLIHSARMESLSLHSRDANQNPLKELNNIYLFILFWLHAHSRAMFNNKYNYLTIIDQERRGKELRGRRLDIQSFLIGEQSTSKRKDEVIGEMVSCLLLGR